MAPAALAFWEASLRKAVATDALKKELDELLLMDEFMGSAEFRKYLDEQHSEIKALLTDRGLVK
jgi:tripartite-type tricarboxylate transporter receptor subunit TctC